MEMAEENGDSTWSRGQILEAVLNVQLDYDITKSTWDKNKKDLLEKVGKSDNMDDTKSKTKLQQMKEVEQYKELVGHYEGLHQDFEDLDKGFELVEDTLKQGRAYYESTTVETMNKLVARNDEIREQGKHMDRVLDKSMKIKETQDQMNKCMNSGSKFMDRLGCLLTLLCLVMTLTCLLIVQSVIKFAPGLVDDTIKNITEGN